MNFAPVLSQIEADGTMLATLDTTLANIQDFYDRMTMATRTIANALGTDDGGAEKRLYRLDKQPGDSQQQIQIAFNMPRSRLPRCSPR